MDDLLRLTLFGGLQTRKGSGPAAVLPTWKARALLAYLAVRADQPHSRSQLAALLWGGVSEPKARKALRQALFWIRRALIRGGLHVDAQAVTLSASAVRLDVAIFERWAGTGAPADLERAVSLYRGELLEGLPLQEPPFEEWLLAERERLREIALEALAKLVADQLARGEDEAALQNVRRLLALDPLQEAAHRAAMRLYLRLGRKGSALRQYRLCAEVLHRELGVEPEPETQELHRNILRHRDIPSEAAAPDLTAAEAPLVGRAREIEQLHDALQRASGGRGSVVAVLGEGGIGKSRLVMESAAAAARVGTRVLVGRCTESQQMLPFGPWAEVLRAALSRGAEGVLDGLHPAWRTALSRLVPDLVAAPKTDPGPSTHLHVFESVAHVLRSLASQRPTMLILEDMHWADEISLRLLSFIGVRIRAWPALLIATVRDEELVSAPTLGRTLHELEDGHLTRISLAPLAREDAVSLAEALGASAAETAMWLASEGNPFVVVEAARALRDGAELDTSGKLPVPQRVHQVIARRLDRLDQASRLMVDTAAVIGRAFSFDVVQRATALPEDDAARALEDLVRRGILREIGPDFGFSHDRVRAVAHGQLMTPRRRLLHRHVGAALEAVHHPRLDQHWAALAFHYQEAGVWDKAWSYLCRAGSGARDQAALREAVNFFERALDVLGHLPDSRETAEAAIDLRLSLDHALTPLGEVDVALEHLEDAGKLADRLEDGRRKAIIAVRLCDKLRITGEYDRAIDVGRTGLQMATVLADATLADEVHFFLGLVHHARGEYRPAIDHLRATVDALDRVPIEAHGRRPYMPALTRLARCLAEIGQFPDAHHHAARALGIAEACGDPLALAHPTEALGMVHLRQRNSEQAIPLLGRSFDLSQAGDFGLLLPGCIAALAAAYARGGRCTSEVQALLQTATEREASSSIRIKQSQRLAWIAEALAVAGHVPEAASLGERALALARTQGERAAAAEALKVLADLTRQQHPPDLERAEGRYRDALALALSLGMRPLAADCHFSLAEIVRVGDPGAADEHLASATTMYQEMSIHLSLGVLQ